MAQDLEDTRGVKQWYIVKGIDEPRDDQADHNRDKKRGAHGEIGSRVRATGDSTARRAAAAWSGDMKTYPMRERTRMARELESTRRETSDAKQKCDKTTRMTLRCHD